jgi:hypothetical protein
MRSNPCQSTNAKMKEPDAEVMEQPAWGAPLALRLYEDHRHSSSEIRYDPPAKELNFSWRVTDGQEAVWAEVVFCDNRAKCIELFDRFC